MDINELINAPIENLNLSEKFVTQTYKMGYRTIREIIDAKPEDLRKKADFSYTWLGELSEFLMRHRILHLLQPATGKNHS